MALDTTQKKLAVMEMDGDWSEPGLPLSPGALGLDDRQQLLWGYPSNPWNPPAPETSGGIAMSGLSGLYEPPLWWPMGWS